MASRNTKNAGGISKKTGKYTNKTTGEIIAYNYWQASREVPVEDLPDGLNRKRVTGNGDSKSEAWAKLNQNWDSFQRGEARRSRTRLSKKMTMKTLFQEWNRNNEAGAVSEVMTGKYEGYFRNHIIPALGERRIDSLTEPELNLFFNHTLASKTKPDGRPLMGGSSRRNVYMALSGCLEFAVRNRYLATNPLRAIKAPPKSKPKDDIDTALTDMDKILAELFNGDPSRECRYLLSFLGLRRSERLGLCWEDIRGLDTDTPTVFVHQQLARRKGEGLYLKPHTKNRRDRSLVLPEPFVGSLRRYRKIWDEMKNEPEWVEPVGEFSDLVFLQRNGFPIDQNDDNDGWNELLNGLGIKPFRAHLTRHLTAVLLAEQTGVSITTVMSVLGHNSEAMSIYYTHVEAPRNSQAMSDYGAVISRKALSGK